MTIDIGLSKYTKDPIIVEGSFKSDYIIADGKIIDMDVFGEKFKAKITGTKFGDGIWTIAFERIM